jgi:pimeloyl-ACP methyl ester carboxylesterase
MRLARRGLLTASILLAVTAPLVATFALHVPRILPQPASAEALALRTASTWTEVKVSAQDGAVLSGWLFAPRSPNGSAVIVLHGVADSRLGALGHAEFLLRHGFTVLVPDSRGHGRSGGELVTYGIREAEDVHCWADLLFQDPSLHRLYGIGLSLGGGILLQSLRTEPRFRAVVADSPFATFREIGDERLQQVSRMPEPVVWPIARLGFAYARVRYGLDLSTASPVAAVRSTHVPVLLIHGTADRNIPLHHSLELQAANPPATKLWVVRGAGHVESLGMDPQGYARRVTEWFEGHP